MESETFYKFLSEKLLHLKGQQNLLKNYSIINNTKNVAKCQIVDGRKCQIINTSEVSRILNNYLEKMSMAGQVTDEPLLRVCQEIEKQHNTTQIKHNRLIPASSSTCASNVVLEGDIFKKDDNVNTSFSTANETEISEDIPVVVINDMATVDDFLKLQNENYPEKDERGNTEKQDNEKLQTYGIIKNTSSLTNRATKEDPKNSEKPVRQACKMKCSSVSNEKAFRSSITSIERPYACSKCQMTFKRNLHLKRHFTVAHTSNKNFKCGICEKLFSRKDYLDKHESGHKKKRLKIKLLEQGIVVRTKIFSKSEK